jgi:hypothetical protein
MNHVIKISYLIKLFDAKIIDAFVYFPCLHNILSIL